MKAKISFKIPEFHSMGIKEINFKEQVDKETTFKSIWKSFNKNLDKNWQSIEFDFNNETILVCRHWLIETNFDFNNSHQITEIN
jgi:hypothetical protein